MKATTRRQNQPATRYGSGTILSPTSELKKKLQNISDDKSLEESDSEENRYCACGNKKRPQICKWKNTTVPNNCIMRGNRSQVRLELVNR